MFHIIQVTGRQTSFHRELVSRLRLAQGLDMPSDSLVVAEVLLPLALPTCLSYAVPPEVRVEAGSYVLVPLGSRTVPGVVWALRTESYTGKALRPLGASLDVPPMEELHRRFVDWVASYYVESPGSILRMVLRSPLALRPARELKAYLASGIVPARLTAGRKRVLSCASPQLPMGAAELAELAGVSSSVVMGLIKEGALEAVAVPALRPFAEPDADAGALALSPAQVVAASELRTIMSLPQANVTLLEGVTGSGKTEVYFDAMAAVMAQGSQILLMLPEIALTRGFLSRVERRFGAEPALWHSDIRPRERERVWRAVASGQARIVIGARSALYLPWKRIGLIVVDEEHEGAYKQDEGVAYHARDMAVVYGRLGGFPVILSSATPSIETFYNAARGRYHHVKLDRRHNQSDLPETTLIDMRTADCAPQCWLSAPLIDAARLRLDAGEQVLLFLNRRGYAPLTLCRACGYHLNCPNCSASLVEHRFRKQLVCHHCGHCEPLRADCPKCGAEAKMVPCGPGIERLAEEAARIFPEARIAILSSDFARGASLRATLEAIEKGVYNLVIGTQLVAKGHHFPELTLVGVVDADLALETSDPRAGERTWQLMAQVAGRAGRGDKPGRALIQTYVPDHPLMIALKQGDTKSFLAQEIETRESSRLPPFARLVSVIVSGADNSKTERFCRELRSAAPRAENIELLGPAAAPLHLVRGRYRWRFLLRADRHVNVQAYVRHWLSGIKTAGSLRVDIDVDPYNFL